MSQLSMRAARKGRPTRAARLRGAASVLAVTAAAAGVVLAGSAQAACTGSAVTITAASSATALDGSPCPASVTIATGTTAVVMPGWADQSKATSKGWVPLIDNSGALDVTGGSPQGGAAAGPLTVQQGATVVFGGQQTFGGSPYAPFNNFLNAAGNVIFEGNGGYVGDNQFALLGSNTITGDLTLEAGAALRIGEYYNGATSQPMGQYAAGGYYDASTINFGPNTNVSLQGAAGAGQDAVLFLNLNSAATIGGYLSATAQSEVWLHAGTLTVNGANTAANPFVGVLQLDPGATFVVGDSSHSGAVFGDPNHTNGSGLALNISRVNGSPVTLQGYGTIYAAVTNAGVVTPGGTAGKPGALTVSSYTQTNTGVLNIEVTPTGASQLKVLGAATLDGTVAIKIDDGHYGNSIFPIVSAGSLSLANTLRITSSGSAAAGLAETPTSIDVVTELTSSLEVFGHLAAADRAHINAFNDSLYDSQTDALRGFGAASKSEYGDGTSAWVQPFGQTSTISHAGYGYDASAAGVTGGIEHRWSAFNALVGFAGSYSGGDLTTDAGQTRATTHTWDAAVYGGFDMPNARIEGTAFYNGYDADVSRRLGSAGTIHSSPKATTYGASLQVSHGLADNVVVPYIRVTYANIDQDALTENGANLLALKVNQLEEGYFDGEAGFKIHPDKAVKLPWGLHSEITLAAQHDFSQTPGEKVVGQFANLKSSPFAFAWQGDQGTSGIVGLNLASDVTSHIQVFGKLDGRFSTYGRTGELRFGASYRF